MAARSAIGIDIGGTNIRAARVSDAGVIEARLSERSTGDPAALLMRMLAAIRALDDGTVAAVGVGVPGRMDHVRRRALSGGYVDLSSVDVVREIEGAFGFPVAIDNDVAMALVAEHALGAAQGHGDVVMLAVGTGIGGAVLSGGRPLRGRGNAGQLGHVSVSLDGPACACGRRGCLEALAAGPALARHMRQSGLAEGTTAEDMLAASSAGDPGAQRAVSAWAAALRAGVDGIVATLDPELVVLGGGLGHAACRALDTAGPGSSWFQCPVQPAALGDDAGMVGCALSALRLVPAAGVDR